MITGIVDYGVGNLGSLAHSLREYGEIRLLDRPADAESVDRLILPGVGNFANCAVRLHDTGWWSELLDAAGERKQPLLGICVGMQLLADFGHEGACGADDVGVSGLGLIAGEVRHISDLGCTFRVPHVGWNSIRLPNGAQGIFSDIPDKTDFYFVHSYAFDVTDQGDIIAVTDYGIPLVAAVRKGQVWGVQFHPEKSSKAGQRILKNFIAVESC
ncbi:imidazole glycerol phosphate synthase subunit HisH [Pusillimonas sp. T2]|uniref:imidazole glycerol phosphate synthase subunit HisH n=1 Tax=Pusillimonas sp. T2 TaxID=1548123 RepID=UPI000B9D22B7|nr:imidazole glycerol phosphate synthase subunit HisH [Pusillimonas sp. T2]OXR47995.1 imidazole glycerol phosphate synthase subunit HisH [Pusillimonas sp. T2]